jgi:DNA-binding NtrC family response regulator
MHASGPIHLLLVGAPGSEFRLAASMARDSGAHVALADCATMALRMLRDEGGDIVMIDIHEDIAGFITQLRSERIAVPVLACGINASADQAVAAIRAGARDYVPLPPQAELMVGDDPELARAIALGIAMAPSSAPVLIVGEAGSGKEILARAIHGASGRRGRFLVVDCANNSPDVLESELFGHAAGAFPGAIAHRRGRIDEACNGTIFLRDAHSLSPAIQLRLLAALQGQSVHRHVVDMAATGARIIASTGSDLDGLVAAGQFNGNLLARLGLVRIVVPPLHARPGDIVPMARYFAERFSLSNDMPVRTFSDEALAVLRAHNWPGNVRELEDVVHRAVLLNRDPVIPASVIVNADGVGIGAAPAAVAAELSLFVGCTVEDMERDLILHTLRHCRGNRTSASTILGISVRTMRNKLKTFIEAGIPVSPAP